MKNHRLIQIFLTLFIFSVTVVYSQTKCDLTTLNTKEIDQLTQNDIRDFLLTFDAECKNYIEYSEVSNELLFKILYKQTHLTLLTIKQYEASISLDYILNELTLPINDSIDINRLIHKVAKTKADRELKRKVLNNLKIANSR